VSRAGEFRKLFFVFRLPLSRMLFKECVEGKNNLCAAGVLGAIVSYNGTRACLVRNCNRASRNVTNKDNCFLDICKMPYTSAALNKHGVITSNGYLVYV
jgi:hypothetical protein